MSGWPGAERRREAGRLRNFVSALAIALLDSVHLGLFGILIPLWRFIIACGFSFPLLQVLGLVNHVGEAPNAASVLGAVSFGLAGLISSIVGLLSIHGAVPTGKVITSTSLVSIVALWFIVRPGTEPELAR